MISPWSIRSWSRVRRVLTCSTSASTLVCSAVRSSTGIWASRALAVELGAAGRRAPRSRRARAASPAGGAAGRRGRRAPGGPAGRAGRRVGFQRSSPACDSRRSRGPCTMRADPGLHRIAQRLGQPAPGHHRQPGPLGRPVRDVDQRRSALLEELARRVVPQVAGHVDVGVGARAPRRAGSRPLPRTPPPGVRPVRVAGDPHAVRGRRAARSATCRAKLLQRGLARPSPIRPVPGRGRARGRRARRRRTPAPRRGAPPASPRRPAAGPRAAARTRSAPRRRPRARPTSPMVGLAPSSGRNRPSPGVENDAWS